MKQLMLIRIKPILFDAFIVWDIVHLLIYFRDSKLNEFIKQNKSW